MKTGDTKRLQFLRGESALRPDRDFERSVRGPGASSERGFRFEHQARARGRRFTEVVNELARCLDRWQAIAAALLTGADCHSAPVLRLCARLPRVQAHDAAVTQDRHNVPNPEFRGLLDDKIHAIAARYTLQQRDRERRLAVCVGSAPDRNPDLGAAHRLDLAGQFSAITVKQHELIAASCAQHLGDMGGGFSWQVHDAALVELGSHENPSQTHAIYPILIAACVLSHMLGPVTATEG